MLRRCLGAACNLLQAMSSRSPAVFSYSTEDVPIYRDVGGTEAHYSELECLLCSRWDDAMSNGVFRYNLSGISTRTIPGQYGLIAQRNPKRFSHRRHPEDMRSLTQPFNPNKFNFNMIKEQEVLFDIQRKGPQDPEQPQENEGNHRVIINMSPIEYGHVLLVPEPKSCLPQVMTQQSIQICLELVALTGHRRRIERLPYVVDESYKASRLLPVGCKIEPGGFYMVFNSLLAYASVNHLHYHFLYMNYPLITEKVGGNHIAGSCYELTGHPSVGFGFQLDTTTADCAREIFQVVSVLMELDLPHHLIMFRGQPYSHLPGLAGKTVVRTLLIPRKPAFGFKKLYESDGQVPPFFAAACELGTGFIPVLDQSRYDTLTEEEVLAILDDKILSSEDFQSLKQRVKRLLA